MDSLWGSCVFVLSVCGYKIKLCTTATPVLKVGMLLCVLSLPVCEEMNFVTFLYKQYIRSLSAAGGWKGALPTVCLVLL